MEIPTVKSCGPFNLSIGGLMIGFFQAAIHILAFLIAMRSGSFWLAPITIMAVAVNIAWIYGIQEKKVLFMLPAFVPFIIASLVGIVFVSIYPIAVSVYIFLDIFEGFFADVGLLLGLWLAGSLLTVIMVYLTIVEYSLCKSLEEMHRQESTRLPYTAAPQSGR